MKLSARNISRGEDPRGAVPGGRDRGLRGDRGIGRRGRTRL